MTKKEDKSQYEQLLQKLEKNKIFGFPVNNILIPDEPEPIVGRKKLNFNSLLSEKELKNFDDYREYLETMKVRGELVEVLPNSTEKSLDFSEKPKKIIFKNLPDQAMAADRIRSYQSNPKFHNQFALVSFELYFDNTTPNIITMFIASPFFETVFENEVDQVIYFLPERDANDWRTYNQVNLLPYSAEAQDLWSKLAIYFTGRWGSTFSATTIQSTLSPWISANLVKNPIKEALRLYKLPKNINLQDVFDKFFADFGQTNAPYAREAIEHLLKAIYKRNTTKGFVKYDDVLILQSSQGVSKSTFTEKIAFGYSADTIDLNANSLKNNDSLIRRSQNIVGELAELSTMKRADIESIKSQISLASAKVRKPYGHADVNLPMRAVLIGTTNNTSILNDPTGSRRFWPLEVTSLPNLSDSERVIQLYKWAEEDLKKRPIFYFTKEEADKYDTFKSDNYAISDPALNIISDYVTYSLVELNASSSLNRSRKGASAPRKGDWIRDFYSWADAHGISKEDRPYSGKIWDTLHALGLRQTGTYEDGKRGHTYLLFNQDALENWEHVFNTSKPDTLVAVSSDKVPDILRDDVSSNRKAKKTEENIDKNQSIFD